MGLRYELERAHIGHPDLNRSKPLRTQPFAVRPHAKRGRSFGSSSRHVEMLHVTRGFDTPMFVRLMSTETADRGTP